MRCPRCAAVGSQPCVTPAGAIARARHKVRPVVEPGELERLTLEAVAAANWILESDGAKVEAVLTVAREVDAAVRRQTERTRSQTGQLFTVANTKQAGDGSIDGSLVYAADVLGRMLDTLGLSPEGRQNLHIEDEEGKTDVLAEAISLHRRRR